MLSARMMRHFITHYIPMFNSENLNYIFVKILDWGTKLHPDALKRQLKLMTSSTIKIYDKVVDQLLPLPTKPHYTFNLRNVAEVFQGILMVSPETCMKKENKIEYLYKLWAHECMRVFSDKLIDTDDVSLFK